MNVKQVSFLRTKILEMMAKYIGTGDLGYVVAVILSEKRATELEYTITNDKLKDTYFLHIKLSKKSAVKGREVNHG